MLCLVKTSGSYEVHDSKLVYQKGKVVASRIWQPDAADAESFLHDLLAELNQRAVTEGIMPDPASGKIGAMDATHFFETVEILQETRQEVEVVVVVAEDIYTEGPVKIKFEVVPLGDRLQGE